MVNVVYIAGSGRTGSTLITQVLGEAPNWFAGGQIRDFSKSHKRDSQCTCGQLISACDFWGEIVRRITSEFGNDGKLCVREPNDGKRKLRCIRETQVSSE